MTLVLCLSLAFDISNMTKPARALTIPLEATLSPPANRTNVLAVTVDAGAVVGTATESIELRGSVNTRLDVELTADGIDVQSITFDGGRIRGSDTTFRMFGGLLQVNLNGLQGTPTTISPPGSVDRMMFDSSEHLFTVDRGTLEAIGQTIDLSESPVSAAGEGFGTIEFSELGMIENNLISYDVTLSLPLMIQDTFVVEDVPLVGSFSVDLLASGLVQATDRIQLPKIAPAVPLQPGDANQDLMFDQQDIVRVLEANTYLTGAAATWGEGDWNGGPGGSPGNPPVGDGRFDQKDIVSALMAAHYLTGPYAAVETTAPALDLLGRDIPVANIPEPHSLALLGLALALLLTGRPASMRRAT